MANDVLIVAEHLGGRLSDTTFELLGRAKELAAELGGRAVVALLGAPDLAGELGAADVVVSCDHAALANYSPEAYEVVLAQMVDERQPRLVLLGTTTAGLDLSGALSVSWAVPAVSYVVDLQPEDGRLVATAQLYGGKMLAEVVVEAERAVCAVTAGSFPAGAGRSDSSPTVETMAPPAGLDALRSCFLELIEPEAGDVDITTADLLVSVGRGIGSRDDLDLAQELADALGAPLSASRPVTDLGWLPKTRQVGKSGLKVKPKAYLAFGISGAPEHLEGMSGADLIIACNTDAKAPIFDVAHFGTTVDLFDLLPELIKQLGA